MSAETNKRIAYLVKMRSAGFGWDYFGPFTSRAAAEVFAEEHYSDDLDNSWTLAPMCLVESE